MAQKQARLGTLAVHGGDGANRTHAHVMPIYQSSTYRFDSVAHGQALWREEEEGYIYGRLNNPNVQATANTIAALEGLNLPARPFALLTGSGMAAISTLLGGLLAQGDTLLSQQALYGATHTLLHEFITRFGITCDTFEGSDLDSLEQALDRHDRIKLVYIETPVNPTMALTDISGVVERAHAAGALVIVDNTFASPYQQRPFEFGADVVVHSTTKYLTGHGTVIGGVIVTPDETLYHDRLLPALHIGGAVAGPMDAWLTEQGLKTFHLRMARHCANGLEVARFLEGHPAVAHVHYPGLESFPQYELACRQMDAFGAMLSFELKGGYTAGQTMMDAVRLCTLAVSLGSVDTLIAHPASMMHFKVPPAERARMGITEGMVRLSVGLEDVEDIIADLDQAMRATL
ncbi:MAG: PLP-dependent transferase [Anaerolineae bacterium]|nr:PLP-dependent transferase [Anaerolineae bacterium]